MTEQETKHEKFLRISGPRLEKAVYHIGLLENLGAHAYENTPEDATAILTKLIEAVDTVAVALNGPRPNLSVPDTSPVASEEAGVEEPADDFHPRGEIAPTAASTPKEAIFQGANVPKDFPNEKEGLELIRVGPMIGAAMEDLLAHDTEAALAKLRALMAA